MQATYSTRPPAARGSRTRARAGTRAHSAGPRRPRPPAASHASRAPLSPLNDYVFLHRLCSQACPLTGAMTHRRTDAPTHRGTRNRARRTLMLLQRWLPYYHPTHAAAAPRRCARRPCGSQRPPAQGAARVAGRLFSYLCAPPGAALILGPRRPRAAGPEGILSPRRGPHRAAARSGAPARRAAGAAARRRACRALCVCTAAPSGPFPSRLAFR